MERKDRAPLSPAAERKKILDDVRADRLKILYIAPERLRDSFFMNAVSDRGRSPCMWVVDEAHCISE